MQEPNDTGMQPKQTSSECSKSLPDDAPFGDPFCDAECKGANKKLACWRWVDGARCGGKVETRHGCRVCTGCGHGAEDARIVAAGGGKSATSLDASLKRSADGLRIANNVWGFGEAVDPDHEPAWAKRRRTAR